MRGTIQIDTFIMTAVELWCWRIAILVLIMIEVLQ